MGVLGKTFPHSKVSTKNVLIFSEISLPRTLAAILVQL